LSAPGVENLLEVLDYRADSQQKAIWIVDHTALTYTNFKEVWMAVKGPEGTKITTQNV
jgi:hypothetical protein